MKKHLFRAAFLLVVGCCMVACSGSDDVTTTDTPQQPQQPAANQAVQLEGTLGAKAGMTRSINADGKGSWQAGDQFAIYYPTTSGNATAIATVSGVNDEGGAEFKATLYGPKIGESTVKFIYPATAHDGRGGIKKSVLANQEGTLNYISQQLDIETGEGTIDVEDRSPRDPKGTLTANTTLEPQVCIYQFNLKKADGNALSATKFVATDGTNTYTVSPASAQSEFCIAMLPATNADFTFTASTTEKAKIYQYQCDFVPANIKTDHLGCVIATDGKVYKYSEVNGIEYSKSFTGKTIESAKFYSQELKLDGGPSVTPVAMIAYVGENTGEDDAEGYIQEGATFEPQKDTYKHGLAVSIYCVGGSKDVGGNPYNWAISGAPANTYTNKTLADLGNTKESGLQYLKVDGYSDNHPAFAAAKDYSVDGFDNSRYGCSSWFMCSAYQLIQILNNYPKTYYDTISDYVTNFFTDLRNIAEVSSSYPNLFPTFWTCTETGFSGSSYKAWYIGTAYPYKIQGDNKYNATKYVRPFFAF
ncbi:MAG: hypothetical protein J6I31_03355 [Prevotella sp.]|nr:hypothetical protein [Prevotella sp.]